MGPIGHLTPTAPNTVPQSNTIPRSKGNMLGHNMDVRPFGLFLRPVSNPDLAHHIVLLIFLYEPLRRFRVKRRIAAHYDRHGRPPYPALTGSRIKVSLCDVGPYSLSHVCVSDGPNTLVAELEAITAMGHFGHFCHLGPFGGGSPHHCCRYQWS